MSPGGAADLAGVRLGRYDLLFPLASGGMGAVYAARIVGREGIGRLVAVKVMLNRNPGDSDVQAFLSEARVTARLDHPNVVRTIELGEDQGSLFIAMELVRGQSLRRVLIALGRERKHLPVPLITRIMIQAANGLHAAHELSDAAGAPLNLIHRDLSPDNILLSYGGQVFVSDFGVAKLSNTASTHTGVVKGKFAYMSPEQVSAEVLDRRSDIFALGILLWEAFTGRRLFKGGTPRETVALILRCSVKNPAELRADLPEALARITLRCLEHSPDERYATAKQVADELRACVKELGLASDERDLVDVLEALFSKERQELATKLDDTERQASSEPEAQPGVLRSAIEAVPGAGGVVEAAEGTGASLGSAVSDARARKKGGRVALALALGAVLVVALIAASLLIRRADRDVPQSGSAVAGMASAGPSASQAPATQPNDQSEPSPAVALSAPAPSPSASAKKVRPGRAPATLKKPPSAGPAKGKDDLFEHL